MIESTETTERLDDDQIRQKLLWAVKREVKQMMEEAVTKKCIHEDNCCVTTLCGAVETCLLHGLKRRAVGLFKTSTTMALLQKIAKTCPSAAEVVKLVADDQRLSEEPSNIFSFSKKSANADDTRRRANRLAMYNRYIWIRAALMHRSLHKIVEYIVNNSSKFYEPEALVCNSVQGPILASLLVGPCALEFTRVKTSDHLWTDPHAGELVQRHRMHSSNRTSSNTTSMLINANSSHSPKFRPKLQINLKRHASASSEETQRTSRVTTAAANPAKDYVESLHQNAKSQLIYGKNNILVQPIPGHDPIPGYLSLHLYQNSLTLKWTPNQLMNGSGSETKPVSPADTAAASDTPRRYSVYWDYAISVNMSSIVYLHCHQHVDGDRIVLVGRDGVQYPPLHIKDKGGHLLAFLTCLENGLAPHGQLDPPLWIEKERGKTFPKLQRRAERHAISLSASDDDSQVQANLDTIDEETSASSDYVFRILFSRDVETVSPVTPNRWQWPRAAAFSQSNSSQSSLSPPMKTHGATLSCPSSPLDANSSVYISSALGLHKSVSVRTSMASLCDTMRRQILSRAFYGWLAYCRHLKTVRTHLLSLVYPVSMEVNEKIDPNLFLTVDAWTQLFLEKQAEQQPIDKAEIYRRIYSGGCDPSIRKQVWPFLFTHYSLDSTSKEREEIDQSTTERYRTLIDEWQNAEELVVKIEKQRASRRKALMKSPQSDPIPAASTLAPINTLQRKDSNMSNDVFLEEEPFAFVARTRTESVIDRSSPYNIIDTTAENDESVSPSSSLTSTTDVYMDAIDVLHDEQSDGSMTPTDYGSFSKETIDIFAANLHRIDKDVARCDRNYPYFTSLDNLKKLRNIMCTYVWDNLNTGYIQGMCDLVAPFLVTFDEEVIAYSCFCCVMKRLLPNFPHGTGMDEHFGHMRSLLQILDSELYEHIHRTGDFTHFYFCYRWFLLDFKREFVYDDIFLVWDIIAAARRTVSKRFVLFIALAMMKSYRDIILDNRMDFTDIIKFFNEMAERHDAREILRVARELTLELQKLIDNK